MYFHFHCDDQGYDLLANLFKRTAIEEMLHVEHLAERILFLKGEVKMEIAESVKYIQDVKEMLTLARSMEEESTQDYNVWANECAHFSNRWLRMKNATITSMMMSWKTSKSLATNTLHCNPSSAAAMCQQVQLLLVKA